MNHIEPEKVKSITELPIVLVVDDEVRSQESLRRVLAEEFQVVCASSASEASAILGSELVHAILCDQRMPGQSGVDFLRDVRNSWPDPVRMIISGYTDAEDIIAGVNEAGIYQYITKPWEPDQILKTVRGALQLFNLQRDNQSASVEMKQAAEPLQKELQRKQVVLKEAYGFGSILRAEDSPLGEAIADAQRIVNFDISVLLTGESGTGKELMARAIHYSSPRSDNAFIVENCGALPDELLESELFGCKKGAFTGAYEDRIGLFEKANGGTIFLDEIGETSAAFQVKLLRVLQEGEVRPLGGQMTRKVDVRVISATNRDLEEEVRKGRFRQDLYYRLAAFPIHLPALRDRPMDIPLLASKFLGSTMKTFSKPMKGFTDQAMSLLRCYDWPGNVRELQNEVQRMVALSDGDCAGAEALSERIVNSQWSPAGREVQKATTGTGTGSRTAGSLSDSVPVVTDGTLKDMVETLERQVLSNALERHRGNISRAAEELGLSRVGLRGKMQRYDLVDGDE